MKEYKSIQTNTKEYNMPDYANGKIYQIVDNTNGKIYIGSTAQPTLARRLAKHVNSYNEYKKGKYHYVTAFDILENKDYQIILIETYPCKNKDELRARETHFQKLHKDKIINKVLAYQTPEERNAYLKLHYQTNVKSITEKRWISEELLCLDTTNESHKC